MGPPVLGAVKALLIAQAIQGTVAGTIRDGETAEPIAGAVVTLTDLNRSARTDEIGGYELRRIPAGPHPMVVRLIGYATQTFHAFVPQGHPLTVDVFLAPEPVPIPGIDVPAPVSVRGPEGLAYPDRDVSAAAMRDDPLLAEPDAIEALAGGEISVMPETPNGVGVRGGTSDQTSYLLDGIPILNPYHAGGISSGWNPDVLSDLRLASAAPAPGSPNALSGVVEGTTREPGDRVSASGSMSTTQSRISFGGPLGSGPARAGYLVSLRKGLPDGIAPKQEATYLRGDTGDWLLKFVAPTLGGRLEVLSYGNENDLNGAAIVPPEDGGATARDLPRNQFEWESRSLGAQWRRALSKTELHVAAWRAGGDASSVWRAPSEVLGMSSARHDRGLVVAAHRESAGAVTDAQVRLERSFTSYRILSDSTRSLLWSVAGMTTVATAAARHMQPVGRRLELSLGTSLAATSRRAYAGPNAQIAWKPSERIRFSGGWTRTHQFEQSLRNTESVAGNVFPVDLDAGAGLAGIPVANARLGVLAGTFAPRPNMHLGAQAYDRRSDGIVLVAPVESGPFATKGFLVGSGVARGLSLDASWSARRCAVTASYGFQRTRLTYGGSSFIPQSGAAHLLRCGLVALPSASTSAHLGLTAAMGRRATGVIGGFEWEANNLLDRGSEFGGSPYDVNEALGAARLPAYFRLDIGVRKQWQARFLGRGSNLALFGTVTNLFGRRNILTYATNPSTGELAGIEMRPRAPLVVGLDWGF